MLNSNMLKSIEEFKDRLISSEIGRKILKPYLFGSYAKGLATKDSDIDLLLITSDGSKARDMVMDVTFEFQMKGVPLGIVTK